MEQKIPVFNIRVYGIFMKDDRVLLTDEYRLGTRMTKFPGGGLKYGEGTLQCLKRECREELGTDIKILEHFYTTDFFQTTFLLPYESQLISVYYLIDIMEPFKFRVSTQKFDYDVEKEGAQSFRFVDLHNLREDELTFPIDKHVVGMLKNIKM